jgi:hypothetical protein
LGLREPEDRAKETRPPSLQFLILIGILILVIGIINDRNILVVVILYLLIILEGILCAIYVFGSATIFGDTITKNRNNDYEFEELPMSNQTLITPIATFLRSAVRGSEFSRREVARIISVTVFEKFEQRKPGEGKTMKPELVELLNTDAQFNKDFRNVVLAYLPSAKSDQKKVQLSPSAYSQSVRRLLTRLLEYETEASLLATSPREITTK